jgi:hypothetical protein
MIPPQLQPVAEHWHKPDYVFDVGLGWVDLVRECHDAVIKEFPDYELHAVKQKWAQLAFHAIPEPGGWGHPGFNRLSEIINDFVDRSSEVCERCGKPGELREIRRNRLTLCDNCELAVESLFNITEEEEDPWY